MSNSFIHVESSKPWPPAGEPCAALFYRLSKKFVRRLLRIEHLGRRTRFGLHARDALIPLNLLPERLKRQPVALRYPLQVRQPLCQGLRRPYDFSLDKYIQPPLQVAVAHASKQRANKRQVAEQRHFCSAFALVHFYHPPQDYCAAVRNGYNRSQVTAGGIRGLR